MIRSTRMIPHVGFLESSRHWKLKMFWSRRRALSNDPGLALWLHLIHELYYQTWNECNVKSKNIDAIWAPLRRHGFRDVGSWKIRKSWKSCLRRGTIYQYDFWHLRFTHITFYDIAPKPGGVGTWDPVRWKEREVCSRKLCMFQKLSDSGTCKTRLEVTVTRACGTFN